MLWMQLFRGSRIQTPSWAVSELSSLVSGHLRSLWKAIFRI